LIQSWVLCVLECSIAVEGQERKGERQGALVSAGGVISDIHCDLLGFGGVSNVRNLRFFGLGGVSSLFCEDIKTEDIWR
jgi:hypothetical protein